MIEGLFTGGPLDGISRSLDIPFAIIEVWWTDGMDPQTVPLFYVNPGTKEVWQYHLQESDYETTATYLGTKATKDDVVIAEPDVWTATGRNFDVFASDEGVEVEIDGDLINFPALGLQVRVAKRQGE